MLVAILAYVTGVSCAIMTAWFLPDGHEDVEIDEYLEDQGEVAVIVAFVVGALAVFIMAALGWL
jgi:hypothetical protein